MTTSQPKTYRVWTATARSGNSGDFSVSFLIPEEHGHYLFRERPTQIATEAFFINPGLFRMYFWDLMIQVRIPVRTDHSLGTVVRLWC